MQEIKKTTGRATSFSIFSEGVPHEEMMDRLEHYLTEVPYKGKDTFLNHTVGVGQEYLEGLEALAGILNECLVRIVYNYFRDEKIRYVYQLDEEFQEILRMAEGTPYELGMYRPDFIYGADGHPRICEIGCRYPVNGWMLSYYLNEITKQLTKSNDPDFTAIPDQGDFLNEFSKRFDAADTIFLIHKKEKGTEVHYLIKELAKKGIKMMNITPEELKLKEGRLTAKGIHARQFFLEMDREELKTFDKEVLRAVITSGRCINDVRTLILIHDKRIMAVLYSQEIMPRYINHADYSFLRPFLIPSYILQYPETRLELVSTSQNWVLKKNSGGRGIDMHTKNDCPAEIWKKILSETWQEYMVQEYIAQKKFRIHYNNKAEHLQLVGMGLFFNARSFGPGLFRGASDNVVNLHEGRGFAFPCVLKKT